MLSYELRAQVLPHPPFLPLSIPSLKSIPLSSVTHYFKCQTIKSWRIFTFLLTFHLTPSTFSLSPLFSSSSHHVYISLPFLSLSLSHILWLLCAPIMGNIFPIPLPLPTEGHPNGATGRPMELQFNTKTIRH